MSSTTAYSELETLLLFQALRAEGASGITPTTFNRISEQLKKVPLICNDPGYDGGRLCPDALRERYLDLLKEEAKQELERQANGDSHPGNGIASPGSRKRKAPSPSLPTVREAQQHSHLIPQLVSRLYTLYRDASMRRLQTHEKNYATLKQERVEYEADQAGEVPQSKRMTTHDGSPQPSPRSTSVSQTQPGLIGSAQLHTAAADTTIPVASELEEERDAQAQLKRYSQAKIDAVINHGPEPQDSPSSHRRVSSNTTLPPLSEMAPQSPRFGIPQKMPASASQPMQPLAHHGYTQSPSIGHQSPYAPPHPQSRPGSVSSPQVQQSVSRPSSSPRPILPPPKGMQLPPPNPGMHVGSPISHPPQPYSQGPPAHYHTQQRHSSGPSPTTEAGPRGYPAPPLAPQPAGYYQQQPPYVDRRTSYTPQHAQHTPPYPAPQAQHAGYMASPYQMQPSDPSKPLSQHHARPQHTPVAPQRTYPFAPMPHNAPATGPRNILPQPSRLVSEVVAALATPPRPRMRPLWKREYPAHVASTPRPRPEIEPLSPTLEPAKSPVRSSRGTRGRNTAAPEDQNHGEAPSKGRASRRKASARDRSPHSVVSSTADDSLRTYTRSQSVSTAIGTNQLSDDRPISRNGVKPEPSTPADTLEDTDATVLTSSHSASGMMTRKRRGTLQSQPQPSAKRKRRESPGLPIEGIRSMSTPPPRSSTVTATRNFAKMSSAIMNDITSHKHASYFAKEVRDKDAPGYSNIVRQPQNLKAIRSAITAGARAIAAASSNVDSPSATGSSLATTVELERNVDLIPPKAIVNGAQLEKELMRMFANAYLFNPGEDGMALSTKEMFEDVEQKISEWRGTERDAGRDGIADDEEENKGKRRKL